MADPSKTEKATPRRLQEAREKGQVARSVEVNSALVLLGALFAFRFAGPYMIESMGRLSSFCYRNLDVSFDMENVYAMVLFYMTEVFKIIAPVLGVVLVVGLLSNYLQVGVLFTMKPLVPKFTNINPVTGFQKLFSRRSLVEFIKSLMKLFLVGIIAFFGMKEALAQLVPTMDMQGSESLKFVGKLTLGILDWIIFAFVILALMDYFYQRWEYQDGLKMTKQEIKDEFKQSEGDPMIKARIRQIQREMARRRMFESIPKADVVITNPTHVAVALQYKDGMQAPMVLAKGERVIAERIKEMARKHGVPIVENPPLARAILKQCPVGAPISSDLFGAVAEVLAFVYRLNQKRREGMPAPG
ncbi:MAG TPA: flagellar biosynthesis protein FlhB [bacterium]|nr:flagellar biosynthesis protein FlhB [bacterium]